MMHLLKTILLVSSQILPTLGSPIPTIPSHSQDFAKTIHNLQSTAEDLFSLGTGFAEQGFLFQAAAIDLQKGKFKPASTLQEAMASLASMPNAKDYTPLELATALITHGLAPKNILDLINGLTNSRINSIRNSNADPQTPIYPQKYSKDAPYNISEDSLRSAIHMPNAFNYGANGKKPVLLVPGTADPAGTTFFFSYEKLLSGTDFADPVWVNIPNDSLGDIQLVSEYVAYAINYISTISRTKIGVLSWSQGGMDVQWALKYWPSARDSVEDFMAISADFHGSLVEFPCLLPNPACTPALRQQAYNSKFVQVLRDNDGDSAFVPTTSVYSGVDEIVQPQNGPNASARLKDVRNVGVTNVQVQFACPGKPAGGFYTHESMLVNPVAFALFVDALKHDGPGHLSRVNMDTVCDQIVPPRLGLDDLLGTEAMAAFYPYMDIGSYPYDQGRDVKEPPIKDYA